MLLVRFDDSGRITHLAARGHAGFGRKGSDIVCSAVTAAVRTFCRLVEDADGIESSGGAADDGSIGIDIPEVRDDRREWFRGVSDSLLCALSDISAEHPGRVSLEIRRETESNVN